MNKIVCIVPFKGNHECKSRLRDVLTNDVRNEVALTMLEKVIRTLSDSPSIRGKILVGGNFRSWKIATEHDFQIIPDVEGGLNNNLSRALSIASCLGYERALILPADLPFINKTEVQYILDLGEHFDAVIVPSKEGSGTNALLIKLQLNFLPSFGHNSFQIHKNSLRNLGASCKVYRSKLIGFDLDSPEDLKLWGPELLFKSN